MSFIEVNDLSKTFRVSQRKKGVPGMVANLVHPKYEQKQAVDQVSFQIEQGEMIGLIGPNGAGKSTLIKMLSGILYPDSGTIQVDGFVPYKDRKRYVSQIGVVFGQKSQLQWDLPVIDSFELLRYVYRIPEQQYEENLKRYVELLDMGLFLNQPVRQLSLGQRMRADIVAALLHSPKIVFFDEPTIGVDVVGKEVIRTFIKELNQKTNTTMIFTTHDMQDIVSTCNRLLIIDKGHMIYDGGLDQIRQKYATTRQLDVEFATEVDVLTLQGVACTIPDPQQPRKKRFTFENHEVQIQSLMRELLTGYDIKDLSITETQIDTIIRKIYQGGEC